MQKISTINENDRKALFHNTATKMAMTDAIIEKNFLFGEKPTFDEILNTMA